MTPQDEDAAVADALVHGSTQLCLKSGTLGFQFCANDQANELNLTIQKMQNRTVAIF